MGGAGFSRFAGAVVAAGADFEAEAAGADFAAEAAGAGAFDDTRGAWRDFADDIAGVLGVER